MPASPTAAPADFLVHTTEPLNAEPPLDQLTASFVTPVGRFFKRNHAPIPRIAPATYRLVVDGLVARPLSLTLADLGRFERAEVAATLQCAGNRRDELHALGPTPGETPWHAGAIGNAVWAGVRLADVLAEAGVQDGARHVAFTGLDRVEKDGKTFGFGGSISLEKARSGEALLADTMNGEPLPPEHGGPLRVVVPGVIGARSVKWVGHIAVQAEESDNHYQQRAYKLFPPEEDGRTADWGTKPSIQDFPVSAVLTAPSPETPVAAGPVVLRGYAVTGGGRRLTGVEVSTDGGATWQPARLASEGTRWTWRLWEAPVELRAGVYEGAVRAWDEASGQPASVAETWNFKGYLHNAWHHTRLCVG
jgi:sulfite oxidase